MSAEEYKLTGDATRDGSLLLDKVEGEGTAERWANFTVAQGGIFLATPWLLFMGHAKEDDERTLYVSYLYGDMRAVADFSKLILDTGRFDYVEFRKNFLKGAQAEGPWVYDRRFVERLHRLAHREEQK